MSEEATVADEKPEPSPSPKKRFSVRVVVYSLLAVALAVGLFFAARTGAPTEAAADLPPLGQMIRVVNNQNVTESSRLIEQLVAGWQGRTDLATLHAMSWGQNVLADRRQGKDAIKLYDAVIERLTDRTDLDHSCRVVLASAQIGKADLMKRDPEARIALYDEVINHTLNYSPYSTDTPNMLMAVAKTQKAGVLSDPAESERLYDEVIAKYGGKDDLNTKYAVSEAAYGKATLATDTEEKRALLDLVIERYSQLPLIYHGYVLCAMQDKSKMVDPQEEARLDDEILDRYKNLDDNFFKSVLAKVARRRVELLPEGEGALPEIDRLLAMVAGTAVASRVEPILLTTKVKHLPGLQEKVELYDLIMGKYNHQPGLYGFVYDAFMEEVESMGNPADKIATLDQALAFLGREEASEFARIEVLVKKAALLPTIEEKRTVLQQAVDIVANQKNQGNYQKNRALDEINAALGGDSLEAAMLEQVAASSESPPDKRAWALLRLLENTNDKETATRLFRQLVATCINQGNPRWVGTILPGFLSITRDRQDFRRPDPEMLALLDKVIAKLQVLPGSGSKEVIQKTLMEKAAYLTNKEEKLAIYDSILAQPATDSNWFEREDATLARYRLQNDPEPLRRFYDQQTPYSTDPDSVFSFNLERVTHEPDHQEKLRILDKIIAGVDAEPLQFKYPILQAKSIKAGLLDDKAASIALYREVIEKSQEPPVRNQVLAIGAKLALVKLLDDPVEQSALLAEISEQSHAIDITIEVLLVLARTSIDSSETLAWYEVILQKYEASDDPYLRGKVDAVLVEKAKILREPAEKAAAVDRLLARPCRTSAWGLQVDSKPRAEAIVIKAEALGLPSYPFERAMQLLNDGNPESVALAGALAWRIEDHEQRREIVDTLIAKYGESADPAVVRVVEGAKWLEDGFRR